MTEFQVGDTIRAVKEGKVVNMGWDWVKLEGDTRVTDLSVCKAKVEVLTPKDDPAKDPVGTLYKVGTDTRVFVKLRTNEFRAIENEDYLSSHFSASELVEYGYKVIGTVPGTPAAQAQKPAEPLVVNYGDAEPDRGKTFKGSYVGYLWSYQEGAWTRSQGEGYRWLSRGSFATVLRDEFPWVEVVS